MIKIHAYNIYNLLLGPAIWLIYIIIQHTIERSGGAIISLNFVYFLGGGVFVILVVFCGRGEFAGRVELGV